MSLTLNDFVAFAYPCIFFAFFFCSLAYSAADKFDHLGGIRKLLPALQGFWIGLSLVAGLLGFIEFFDIQDIAGGITISIIFLTVSHLLRGFVLRKSDAVNGGHSDLFNTKLAFLSNVSVSIWMFEIISIPKYKFTISAPFYYYFTVFIVSMLMILKECFYLLRYVKSPNTRECNAYRSNFSHRSWRFVSNNAILKNGKNLSIFQILFGEIIKSSAVIFAFSITFLMAFALMLPDIYQINEYEILNWTAMQFGSLAFCSLMNSNCAANLEYGPLIWATYFLVAVGYYVLGIALAAAVGKSR